MRGAYSWRALLFIIITSCMRKFLVLLTLSLFVFSGCSLFKKDPQTAVNDGIKKFAAQTRSMSRTNIKGTLSAPDGETVSSLVFNMDLTGYADSSDKENPTFDMTLKGDATVDGKKGSVEVQFRGLEKKLYVKLNDLSIPGDQNEAVKAQLTQLASQWWEIPLNETPLGEINKQQQDIQEKLKTLVFFQNATEEGVDEVEGTDATKYRVEMNKDAIKELILAIASAEGNVVSPEEEKAISDSLQDVEFSGAVSVGDDDIAHRIKGTLSVQPTDGTASVFDIDYSGWSFGDEVEVTVPEGTKPFNALDFLPLIGALSAATPSDTKTPSLVAPTTPAAVSTATPATPKK